MARLHGSQELEGKYYGELKETIVLVFFNVNLIDNNRMCNTFTLKNEDGLSFVEESQDRMKIRTVEMAKLDVNKPLEEMNEQEKMIYYFLNCHKGIEDSKIKVMIESDGVIQMLEKRVETISDDGWKKIIEDFRKLHENEERMERQLELEELQKVKEEVRKEKEELEKYRKETADVEKKTNDASFKANEKLVQLKALEEEIQKSVKSFDSSIQEEEIEKSLALIGQQMDALEKSEKELQKKLEVAKEAVAEKQKLEAEIPELEQMQKKLQEEEQERKDQLLVSERDKANAEEQAVKVRGKLEFPEKAEAEQKIKELDKQKKEIDKNLNAAQKAFQDCSQSVEAAKTKKKTLEKQIAGNKETDMEERVQARQEVSGAKKELQKQMEEIRIRYENNLKIRNAIDKQSAKLLELERNWTQVREISDTVNGKIKGGSKEKIKFETYIQTNYFDRIIARANTRFMVMSGGQYELKRQTDTDDRKSQSGLELNVIDHYNGSERSVKTLSGGESFKASLSLALGLSDEIQAGTGGIRLDAMFVDEGFGSLDEESLEQAMKALNGLTEGNRLVGIISHVQELKARIEKQIVVTKEKAGGSRVELKID